MNEFFLLFSSVKLYLYPVAIYAVVPYAKKPSNNARCAELILSDVSKLYQRSIFNGIELIKTKIVLFFFHFIYTPLHVLLLQYIRSLVHKVYQIYTAIYPISKTKRNNILNLNANKMLNFFHKNTI